MDQIERDTHLKFLKLTIELAKQSPPKPTNFCVGCVIVSYADPATPQVLSTGYTLELPGNTHAEQCALSKLLQQRHLAEDDYGRIFGEDENIVLYTSMEPCGLRLSANLPCVQRIIATKAQMPNAGVRGVVFGAKEPGTFVQDSQSCKLMTETGIDWKYLPDFEEEILSVAKAGHIKDTVVSSGSTASTTTPDTASQLRPRREDEPLNRKKRMMEG